MNQLKSLDLFKFIAALMVVAIHAYPIHSYYAVCSYRIAVPFFFISSSFLFWRKSSNIKKYVQRLILLYLAWFIIEIPIVYERFFIYEDGLKLFLKALLFHSTFYVSWYIMASIQSMIIVYYLSKRFSNKYLLFVGALLYLFSLSASSLYGRLPDSIQTIVNSVNSVIPLANSFVVAIIFVVIGKMVAENTTEEYKKSLSLLLASICLWFVEVHLQKEYVKISDAFIMLPFIAYYLMMTLISDKFPKITLSNNLLLFFRKSSILIYLSHMIFIRWYGAVGLKDNILSYLLIIISCILFSYFIIKSSNKIKLFKYLY